MKPQDANTVTHKLGSQPVFACAGDFGWTSPPTHLMGRLGVEQAFTAQSRARAKSAAGGQTSMRALALQL